ncbi:MAG: hypothetical protein Q7O66_06260, partial [Dehalococcoidia bacterium]|nr:hypothetical protein [Dehalococcoidia bacterium]
MEEQASRRVRSRGKCRLCDRTLTKAGMTRHLQTCWAKETVTDVDGPKLREGRLFLITVGGRNCPD